MIMMMMMMKKIGVGELHQALRNLCFNTDWNYAVFWKFKHRDRMMLTWEDAYYDKNEKNDSSESNWFDNMVNDLQDACNSKDLLGLAVAKMSCHVYSLGEGIVGQVAVTGKHLWISGDQLVNDSCLSLEHCDGWKTQFAAGIRTVAVVAVLPHGAVQLGFLNIISEDLKLVNHIRELFFELQSSLTGCIPSDQPCSIECSPCPSDISTRSSCSWKFHNHMNNQDGIMENERSNMCSPLLPSVGKTGDCSYLLELHGDHPWMNLEMIENHQGHENSLSGISNSLMLTNPDENIEFQNKRNDFDNTLKASFMFPAGCELYEALGPGYCKPNGNFDWETGTTETETVNEMPEGMSSSNLLTKNSDSQHLLEAVIANVCCSNSDDKDSKSFSRSSVEVGERLQPPQTGDSSCYSFDRLTNLEPYGSSQGFSSASHSRCSEQLERSQEPAIVGKKRARPGESSRPRPRDRQLIQDRIKELRELVPSGSKCSIDSLLERTIKHMLFMQSITKHADKIDKCAESKLLGKETGVRGASSHEQGSSWAMEVGNHLKVCPIIVENIGVNGQMLVEMLCEECVHFLEIADAIRSLGLTILKGVTETRGEKTWMCFVVEGQNNRSMHRMDILWSLVQILQSKTKL